MIARLAGTIGQIELIHIARTLHSLRAQTSIIEAYLIVATMSADIAAS
jgi:hypothetical protein